MWGATVADLEGAEPPSPPWTTDRRCRCTPDIVTTVMYYGDVIASYKQVTYSESLSPSLLQAVDPPGKGSATRVLLLHSARFSAPSTLSCKSSMLQQSLYLSSNTSCKNDTKSEPTERLPSLWGRAPPLSVERQTKWTLVCCLDRLSQMT